MQTATRSVAPENATATMTITSSESTEQSPDTSPAGTLRVRGGTRSRPRQQVEWRDDVVDNEGSGKKSSKICCIYHKPRRFDESSDEDSSDSDSDSDSDSSGCDHAHDHHSAKTGKRAPGPNMQDSSHAHNAYESTPRPHQG